MTFLEVLAAVAAVAAPLIGLQTFWIAQALTRLDARLDRVDDHLDRIEATVLRDLGERVTRLEERTRS